MPSLPGFGKKRNPMDQPLSSGRPMYEEAEIGAPEPESPRVVNKIPPAPPAPGRIPTHMELAHKMRMMEQELEKRKKQEKENKEKEAGEKQLNVVEVLQMVINAINAQEPSAREQLTHDLLGQFLREVKVERKGLVGVLEHAKFNLLSWRQ